METKAERSSSCPMAPESRSQTAEVNFDCQVGQVFDGDTLGISVIYGDLVLVYRVTLDS